MGKLTKKQEHDSKIQLAASFGHCGFKLEIIKDYKHETWENGILPALFNR